MNSGVMDDVFETLISSYIENKVGIANHFLSIDLANQLKQNLVNLNQNELLTMAKTGNAEKLNLNIKVRSDLIFWLDKQNNNLAENLFFTQIELFIKYLNMTCFTGIVDYEFHYSLYNKGSFYIKHLDQFKNDSRRTYSIISYLNQNWQPNDGGELMVYQENNTEKISPTLGKTILFKSNELPHEVLITNQPRMSITGWLKKG